jgi:nucleoside 2-deoxyribosyltransferase
MKIYLAGPDVFLLDAKAIGRAKQDLCAQFGLTGLFPLDNAIAAEAKEKPSLRIFRGNTDTMTEADAIIANLTPFRGPSADAGTVYELGFMAGLGKFCVGYSNDGGSYRDRVVGMLTTKTTPDGACIDDDGNTVEDFGLADNLMIIHGLETFGCPLIVPNDLPKDPLRDLAAFEACVRWLAKTPPRNCAP